MIGKKINMLTIIDEYKKEIKNIIYVNAIAVMINLLEAIV